jgi:hypothetical protein
VVWLVWLAAGRQPADDGVQCWAAVSTERFARQAIEQTLPLQVNSQFSRPGEAAMQPVTSGGPLLDIRLQPSVF